MRSPLIWYGGKYYMAKELIKLFPNHTTYVEVFGGAGHVLFRKQSSDVEVYNDIHSGLYTFFKVLREKDKRDRLIEKLNLTPYLREEFKKAKNWREESDEVEKARKFYVNIVQAMNGVEGKQWGYSVKTSRRKMAKVCSSWINKVEDRLLHAVERLRKVQVENIDFRRCIKKYDRDSTFMYLDPPYIKNTRVNKDTYKNEMSNNDHEEMVDLLLTVDSKILLSGYENKIYKKLEKNGWEKIKVGDFYKSSSGKNNYGEEYIWSNYELGL